MVIQDRIVQRIDAEYRVDGACLRCGKCCVCWFYETPYQEETIPPRKGWSLPGRRFTAMPYLERATTGLPELSEVF
ncbi:hypothetical protein ACFLUS_01705 [Chloroflexota bacterium]